MQWRSVAGCIWVLRSLQSNAGRRCGFRAARPGAADRVRALPFGLLARGPSLGSVSLASGTCLRRLPAPSAAS